MTSITVEVTAEQGATRLLHLTLLQKRVTRCAVRQAVDGPRGYPGPGHAPGSTILRVLVPNAGTLNFDLLPSE